MVTIPQMKDALTRIAGSKLPMKITLSNGEVMVRYVRGFADAQRNVVLVSENAHTLALKIVEVKDILKAEFGAENTDGEWQVLRAKWLRNIN